MSERLRFNLQILVEDERRRVEKMHQFYAKALKRAAQRDGLALTVTVHGIDVSEAAAARRVIEDLQRLGLVTVNKLYTDNIQLRVYATPEGAEIVRELSEESMELAT